MTHLALIAMLQLVISTKAGLVNHVQGVSNVSRLTQVPAGTPIRTALNGYVEVLLTPGVFLRLDENSEVVLDRVEIADAAVIRSVSVILARRRDAGGRNLQWKPQVLPDGNVGRQYKRRARRLLHAENYRAHKV